MTLYISGVLNDPEFIRCKLLGEEIKDNSFMSVEIMAFTEMDYSLYLQSNPMKTVIPIVHRKEHLKSYRPVVYIGKAEYIGSREAFVSYCVKKFNVTESTTEEEIKKKSIEEYRKYIQSTGYDYAYLQFTTEDPNSSNSIVLPRVVVELYKEKCPKTCENFIALCTGDRNSQEEEFKLCYEGNPVHRIMKNGWIQAGDVEHFGKGDGDGYSIYGKHFPDECFEISHDRPGILSMANAGPHTNGSQFFITMQPMEWLDKKKVAFGRVISGYKAIEKINEEETEYERPVRDIIISKCGRLVL